MTRSVVVQHYEYPILDFYFCQTLNEARNVTRARSQEVPTV
jgi:hypothetical protein